jgi:two-component system LytT family response regulator
VLGEARTAREAAELIKNLNPDVIFLDIQMPRESGFDLLDMIDTRAHVVFVTAYDEYAVRAFEVNALDYLLKPVEPERLAKSIERLSAPSVSPGAGEKNLVYSDSLYVKTGNRAAFLMIEKIICIVAADDYTEVHLDGGAQKLVSKSMKEWEARLPGSRFQRIHRSVIVNITKVDHVVDKPNTTGRVFMKGLAEPLPMSRRRKSRLARKLR